MSNTLKYVAFSFMLCLITIFECKSQPPAVFKYQCQVINSSSLPLINTNVKLRLTLKEITTDKTIFSEIHHATTDTIGLIYVYIGKGSLALGSGINTIDWAKYYKLISEIALTNDEYNFLSSQYLYENPIALYSKTTDLKGVKGEKGPKGEKGVDILSLSYIDSTLIIFMSDSINLTARYNFKGTAGDEGIGISKIHLVDDTLIIELINSIYNIQGIKGDKGVSGIDAPFSGYQHYVGEFWGGGIVAHVYRDSLNIEHGIIVNIDYPIINSTQNLTWSNVTTLIGPLAQSLWNGRQNTTSIVNQIGHISSIAFVCDTLTTNGYSDWYLPSIGEISSIMDNIYTLESALIKNSKNPIYFDDRAIIDYISSTENEQNGYFIYRKNHGIINMGDTSGQTFVKNSNYSSTTTKLVAIPIRVF